MKTSDLAMLMEVKFCLCKATCVYPSQAYFLLACALVIPVFWQFVSHWNQNIFGLFPLPLSYRFNKARCNLTKSKLKTLYESIVKPHLSMYSTLCDLISCAQFHALLMINFFGPLPFPPISLQGKSENCITPNWNLQLKVCQCYHKAKITYFFHVGQIFWLPINLQANIQ